MAEHKGDTPDNLLEELESIRGLLQEEDDIPVLSEVIETLEPLPENTPQQPSLFQPGRDNRRPAPSSTEAGPTESRPKASGENPFLPEHIRARLHGNRPPPVWDELPTDTSEPATSAITDRDKLVAELVESCLPEIERQLRRRLESMTTEQLRQLLDQD